MDWRFIHFIRLKSWEAGLHFLLSVKRVVKADTTLLFVIAVGRLELGLLGLEVFVCIVIPQKRGDQVLVNDVALELRCGDDIAVAELEVLDEQTGAIERLLAADAGQLLVDFVALLMSVSCSLQEYLKLTNSIWRFRPESDLNSCPQTRQALLWVSGRKIL